MESPACRCKGRKKYASVAGAVSTALYFQKRENPWRMAARNEPKVARKTKRFVSLLLRCRVQPADVDPSTRQKRHKVLSLVLRISRYLRLSRNEKHNLQVCFVPDS